MANIPLEKEVPYPGITPWLYIRAKMNQIINALGKTVPSEGYKNEDVGKLLTINADKEVGLTSVDLTQFASVDLSNCDLDTDEAGKYLKVASDGSIAYDTPGGGGSTTTHYTSHVNLVAAMIALDVGTEISVYGSYVQNAGMSSEANRTFYVSRAHKIASDDYLASGGYKGTSWTGVYELQTAVGTNGLGFIEASGSSDWMNDNFHPGSVDVYLTVYE